MVFDEEQRMDFLRPYVEVLSDVRETSGITKRDLAETVGVHEKHVSHIENSRRAPSIETLIALMAGAGVDKRMAQDLCTSLIAKFEWKD